MNINWREDMPHRLEHSITCMPIEQGMPNEQGGGRQSIKDALLDYLIDWGLLTTPGTDRLKKERLITDSYQEKQELDGLIKYKPFKLNREMREMLDASCRAFSVIIILTDEDDKVNAKGDPSSSGTEDPYNHIEFVSTI